MEWPHGSSSACMQRVAWSHRPFSPDNCPNRTNKSFTNTVRKHLRDTLTFAGFLLHFHWSWFNSLYFLVDSCWLPWDRYFMLNPSTEVPVWYANLLLWLFKAFWVAFWSLLNSVGKRVGSFERLLTSRSMFWWVLLHIVIICYLSICVDMLCFLGKQTVSCHLHSILTASMLTCWQCFDKRMHSSNLVIFLFWNGSCFSIFRQIKHDTWFNVIQAMYIYIYILHMQWDMWA